MVSRALLIAAKDTRIFLANRFAVAFAFIFPFLFIIGFTLALRGVGPEDEQLMFVVASADGGPVAAQIVDGLVADPEGRFVQMPHAEAASALGDGTIAGYVAIPADFSASVLSGRQTSITVHAQADEPETAAALQGVASSVATLVELNGVVAEAVAALVGESGADPADVDLSEIPQVSGALEFEADQVGDVESFDASAFTVPGYLVMFVFFAAALAAQSIAIERESHTLERLVANGVRRESIILGKLLAGAYRGLMQLAVLWIVGVFGFGLDLGVSPAAVVGISLLMVVASSAFSVMLASVVKTRRAIDSAAVLVSLVLAPIGGCWWPAFIMPQWMQTLAKATPHGWATQGFNKLLLFGATGSDVTAEMAALAAFSAIFLAVAVWRFRTAAPL